MLPLLAEDFYARLLLLWCFRSVCTSRHFCEDIILFQLTLVFSHCLSLCSPKRRSAVLSCLCWLSKLLKDYVDVCNEYLCVFLQNTFSVHKSTKETIISHFPLLLLFVIISQPLLKAKYFKYSKDIGSCLLYSQRKGLTNIRRPREVWVKRFFKDLLLNFFRKFEYWC